MAKPHRKLKKANHGKRPANSKARRLKRKDIRTWIDLQHCRQGLVRSRQHVKKIMHKCDSHASIV